MLDKFAQRAFWAKKKKRVKVPLCAGSCQPRLQRTPRQPRLRNPSCLTNLHSAPSGPKKKKSQGAALRRLVSATSAHTPSATSAQPLMLDKFAQRAFWAKKKKKSQGAALRRLVSATSAHTPSATSAQPLMLDKLAQRAFWAKKKRVKVPLCADSCQPRQRTPRQPRLRNPSCLTNLHSAPSGPKKKKSQGAALRRLVSATSAHTPSATSAQPLMLDKFAQRAFWAKKKRVKVPLCAGSCQPRQRTPRQPRLRNTSCLTNLHSAHSGPKKRKRIKVPLCAGSCQPRLQRTPRQPRLRNPSCLTNLHSAHSGPKKKRIKVPLCAGSCQPRLQRTPRQPRLRNPSCLTNLHSAPSGPKKKKSQSAALRRLVSATSAHTPSATSAQPLMLDKFAQRAFRAKKKKESRCRSAQARVSHVSAHPVSHVCATPHA